MALRDLDYRLAQVAEQHVRIGFDTHLTDPFENRVIRAFMHLSRQGGMAPDFGGLNTKKATLNQSGLSKICRWSLSPGVL